MVNQVISSKFEGLKLLKDEVLNGTVTIDIKIDYRKKVYDLFYVNKEKIDEKNIDIIETALLNCPVENKKLDINLIKLGLRFYEEKKDYKNSLKWINYYDYKILNKEKFGTNRYSDYDLYFLKKAKILQMLNKETDLIELEKEYIENDNCDNEVSFFIRYYLCKLYFYNKKNSIANDILEQLLLIRRDAYLLALPIKHKHIENMTSIYLMILELLIVHDKRLDLYIYDYIISLINELEENVLYDELKPFIVINDNKISSCQKDKFNKVLYNFIIEKLRNKNVILTGYVDNITKSGNGFIKCKDIKENIFISKERIKKIKKGESVKFFTFDSKDKEGNIKPSALLLREEL